MKYLFRFLGLVVIWPLQIILIVLVKLLINLVSILWNLNFNHLEPFVKDDLYFSLGRHTELIYITEQEEISIVPHSYKLVYTTPMDLLKNKKTKLEL